MRVERITFPLASPGAVHAYLLLGEGGVAVVDAGPPGAEARELLRAALARHGLGPGDVGAVVLTHAHRDHAGQAEWLRRHGARVYLHPAEASGMVDDEGARGGTLLRACGYPEEEVAALRRELAWAAGFEPPAAWEPLADGAEVPLPGLGPGWRAWHVPGHAPGHVVLAQPGGPAFVGDFLIPGIPPLPLAEDLAPAPDGGPVARYLAALRRASAWTLGPAYPGHGDPFPDLAARAREGLVWVQRRLRHLAAVVEQAGGLPVRALVDRFFPGARGLRLLFAVAEVVAYLLCLEAEGRVRLAREVPLAARPAARAAHPR